MAESSKSLSQFVLSTANGVTTFYSNPTIYYERVGNQITCRAVCQTYAKTWNDGSGGATYADLYTYYATLSFGGENVTFQIKPSWSSQHVGGYPNDYLIDTYSSSTITITSSSSSVSGTLSFSSTNGGANRGSATFSLDVAGPSTMTFPETKADLGTVVPITITRGSTSYTHTLQYYASNVSLTTIATNVATSYNWTVPMSLANAAPSASDVTVVIRCTTYNGNSVVGTSEVIAVFSIPASVVPTISAVSIAPYNANTTVRGWGVYLQGFSQADISVTAAGAYSSTISNYNVYIGSSMVFDGTTSSGRTEVLNTSGTVTARITVTDSRGRQASTTRDITVYQYTQPNVTGLSCYRCDSTGTPATNGTYIRVQCARSYSTVGNNNSCSMSVKYAQTGGAYSTPTALSDNTPVTLGNGTIALTSSYTVVVTVQDSLGSREVTVTVPTELVTMNFKDGGNSVCFGGYATYDNCFQIASGWKMVISSGMYGNALPATGVEGQLFFLLVD